MNKNKSTQQYINISESQPTPSKTPTMYNVKIVEGTSTKQDIQTPQFKLLREAHITELTLGDQTLRVMDAGHIQGVINMIEKHHNGIAELNKGVNNLNRAVRAMEDQIRTLHSEIDGLKGLLKFNGL